MAFLPIVYRELREAARRRVTWLIRCAAAGISLFWVFTILSGHNMADAWIGRALFNSVSGATLVACLLASILAAADSISREKRDGTLGLLFLTPLKTHDVILGKLASVSLNLFYGVLAVAPVLMISVLFGGVTPGEVARMALLLVLSLGLAVSLSLLASALCETEKNAFGTAMALVVLFMAILPTAQELVREFRPASTLEKLLNYASPTLAFFESVTESNYRADPARYWITCAITGVYGAASVWLAGQLTKRACRFDRSERWEKWRRFLLRLQFGNAACRRRRRRRWMEAHPIAWLYLRERTKQIGAWLPVFLAAALTLVACFDRQYTREWLLNVQGFIFIAWTLNLIFKIMVASEAAGSFAEPRRTGALSLVMATSLRADELLDHRWRALVRQFVPPLVVLVAWEIGTAVYANAVADHSWSARHEEFAGLFGVFLIIMLTDALALTSLALWIGLKTKSSSRATFSALLRILVPPWVLVFLLGRGFSEFIGCYFVFGLIFGAQGLYALGQLHTNFRVLACNPHLENWNAIQKEQALGQPQA